jgi:multidrug efflux pump subunit AcrA (membrane-fusion protein)
MDSLPDGEYSVFVIDAELLDDGTTRLEITITVGEHKGEVVAVRASHLTGDPVMMMGLPGTLRVVDGVPRVDIES